MRAIEHAVGSQGVRGREPAVSRECLYPDILVLATVFATYYTMAKCGSAVRIELKRVGGSLSAYGVAPHRAFGGSRGE